MTIEQAIKKAEENPEFEIKKIKTIPDYNIYYYVMSPNFWQSLGKAMGWKLEICKECGSHHGYGNEEWLCKWHKFIDHLSEGKSVESYF